MKIEFEFINVPTCFHTHSLYTRANLWLFLSVTDGRLITSYLQFCHSSNSLGVYLTGHLVSLFITECFIYFIHPLSGSSAWGNIISRCGETMMNCLLPFIIPISLTLTCWFNILDQLQFINRTNSLVEFS